MSKRKAAKIGRKVLSSGPSNMAPPKISPKKDEVYKIKNDGKIQIRSSKYGLKTGDQIVITTADGKTIALTTPPPPGYLKIPGLEKDVGKTISLKDLGSGRLQIAPAVATPPKPTVKQAPAVATPPKPTVKQAPAISSEDQSMPSELTKRGEKEAKKKIRKTNWADVRTISQGSAAIMSNLLTDYYDYDKLLKEPKKPTILLLGPPGIGKSVGIRDSAQAIATKKGYDFTDYNDELGRKLMTGDISGNKLFIFVDLRLTELEPQDLAGLPQKTIVKGVEYMQYLTPLWAQVLHKFPGILLLDELTNISRPDILSASYKIALEKKVGFTKFHPGVMVVAAGNRPEDSQLAQQLPAPLMDRLLKIGIDLPPLKSWSNWMNSKYGDGWDKATLAYLMWSEKQNADRKEFYNMGDAKETGMTLENFPTPRSWSNVAVMLPQIVPENAELLMKGYLGDVTGAKFMSFLKHKPPAISELIKNPSMWNDLKLDTKFLSLVALSNELKDSIDKEAIKVFKKEAKVDISTVENQLKLVKAIGKDKGGAELSTALATMIGPETLAQAVVVLAHESVSEKKIDLLTGAFSKYTVVNKLVKRLTECPKCGETTSVGIAKGCSTCIRR